MKYAKNKTAEFKVVALREAALPESMMVLDTPDKAADYYSTFVKNSPVYRDDVEQMVVLFLNTRRRCFGFQVVSTGILDSVLAHPREVFRTAIMNNAHGIIIMHGHPSGESTPSEADIKATRDLVRAGQLLKIEVLDHVIMGAKRTSLRELGYFCF